ncbi:MAG: hypothetical protein RLZZ414_273 [Bacteroidota bacterium]|jgi:hypothetical protein
MENLCEYNCWIELLDPIITALLGLLLLSKIESIKNSATKSYDFTKKWADEFYLVCNEYMNGVEKFLSRLHKFQNLNDKNNSIGTKIQLQITDLNLLLPEYDLRIRRMTSLLPKSNTKIESISNEILNKLDSMIKSGKGNFDDVSSLIRDFNKAANETHKEMLKLK